MKFNDITTKDGIYQDIDFLCGTTSASYPILDKRRNIYNAYNDVSRLIWEVAYGWQYDDRASDLPIASTTLTHGTQRYTLPTNAQRIEAIEIKDKSSNWLKLKPIDHSDLDIALTDYLETNGLPVYYDLVGRNVNLYPPPSSAYCTLSSGMKMYVSRDVSAFASAATTEPGFARPFHRILSLQASIDFVEDNSKKIRLIEMRDRLEKGMIRFYSKRAPEIKTNIQPNYKRHWRQWL